MQSQVANSEVQADQVDGSEQPGHVIVSVGFVIFGTAQSIVCGPGAAAIMPGCGAYFAASSSVFRNCPLVPFQMRTEPLAVPAAMRVRSGVAETQWSQLSAPCRFRISPPLDALWTRTRRSPEAEAMVSVSPIHWTAVACRL